jgi:hypothetical protein
MDRNKNQQRNQILKSTLTLPDSMSKEFTTVQIFNSF